MEQNNLFVAFCDFVKRYSLIEKGVDKRIIVACSGGSDSMVLLDCLFRLKDFFEIDIIPVHINHLLRETSTQEASWLAGEIKEKYGIVPVVIATNIRKIAEKRKIGIEECGHHVRKNILNWLADKLNATKIAIGHNLDDQAETVIFRIIRGTGVKGLCGMKAVSGRYIRPLLFFQKSDIARYARENNINYVEDRSNYELHFDRNVIRHKIMPLFKEINKEAKTHIFDLSLRCQELDTFIREQQENVFKKYLVFSSDRFLILEGQILKLGDFLSKELLRHIYQVAAGTINGVDSFHINRFYEEARKKKRFSMQFPKDVVFTKSSDIIFVNKKGFQTYWHIGSIKNGRIVLPFQLGFFDVEIKAGDAADFVVRGFSHGDMWKGEKFRHILYELGVPDVLRGLVPLLAKEKQVYYTPLCGNKDFFYDDDTTSLKISFLEGDLYSKIFRAVC